jgi:glycosyltransferase involved in cell wall biosynthesis
MKILHILETARAEAGGPVENAKNLGILWNRNGHVHDMVTLDPAEPMTLANYPGKITALGSPRGKTLRGMYRYSPDFVPWLRQHARDYDAVIVSGLWRYQTRGALRALRDLGVPYFVFTHGMLDPWFRRRYPLKHAIKQLSWWLAEGPLLRGATHVMFTCEEEGVQADKAFWPYQVKGMTVGYGTSDIVGEAEEQKAAFRALMPKLGDRPFLLFLSRIHEKKGRSAGRGFCHHRGATPRTGPGDCRA